MNTVGFQGMTYIHDSSLERHGNLSSLTCMVDSRWVLKVSCYGLYALRVKEIALLKDKDEDEYYNGQLELPKTCIQGVHNPAYITEYSFATVKSPIKLSNSQVHIE